MKIAIAIPCYNCESQIVRVLTELNPILKEQKLIEEVLIIDNKSDDRTLSRTIEIVEQLENKHIFSVYQNFENIGLGGSHKIAFSLAKSSGMTHLLLLHGDHQASAADIPNLIQSLLIENGITTLGSRFLNLKNITGYSQHRKIGNIILNFISTLVCKTKISDLGSGLNIFRLDDFNEKVYQSFDNEFTFNMDLLLYLITSKKDFQFVPIKWTTLDQISNARSLKVGVQTLMQLFFWLLSIKRIHRGQYKTKKIMPK